MKAPDITENIQWLPRELIIPGPNARKSFPQEKLAELVDSMREHGFSPAISSLLVRPIEGGKFELVAGERRWRAAGMAGLSPLPAVVREMSAREALELHLIENLQREQLNPMEEAIGFRMMMDILEDGKPVFTPATIATRVGKDERYISRRLCLYRLAGTEAGEAVATGIIGVRHGEMIASLPTEGLRAKVAGLVLRNPYGPSPLPEQGLQSLIHDDYMRQLRGTKFDRDDADLVPIVMEGGERIMGGPCGTCPHNSANGPEAKSRTVAMCSNVECYRKKEEAAYAHWQAEATADNRIAIDASEAAAIFDFTGRHLAAGSGYIDLSEAPAEQDLRAGVEDPGPWKKLIDPATVTIRVARDESGTEHELLERNVAIQAATQAGHGDIFKARPASKAGKGEPVEDRDAKAKEETLAKKKTAERAASIAQAELSAIRRACQDERKLGGKALEAMLDNVILSLWDFHAEETVVTGYDQDLTGRDAVDYLESRVKKTPEELRLGYLLELGFCLREPKPEYVGKWAKALGVDLRKVRKAKEAAFAEEDRLEAERLAFLSGLAWTNDREMAEDFDWTGANICEAPASCTLDLKTKRAAVAILVARSEKGWHVGHKFACGQVGKSTPPSRMSTAYSGRDLAVASGLREALKWIATTNAPKVAKQAIAKYLEMLAPKPERKITLTPNDDKK